MIEMNENECEAVIIPQKLVDRLSDPNIYMIPYGTNDMFVAFTCDYNFISKKDIEDLGYIEDMDAFAEKCFLNSCRNHPVKKQTLYDKFKNIGVFDIFNIPENVQETVKNIILIESDSQSGIERVCDNICEFYTQKYKCDIVIIPEYDATILIPIKAIKENNEILTLARKHAEIDAHRNNSPLLCTTPVIYPYKETKEV